MDDSIIIFAARYAHRRNTGTALMVVSFVLKEWGRTREMLYRESFEATYCREDWKRLQDKFEGGAE